LVTGWSTKHFSARASPCNPPGCLIGTRLGQRELLGAVTRIVSGTPSLVQEAEFAEEMCLVLTVAFGWETVTQIAHSGLVPGSPAAFLAQG
jgi:hypothetical protein